MAVEERRRQALSLRIAGLSLEAIGRALNLSTARVHGLIHESLQAIPATEVAELRKLECERLDALYAAGWKNARMGDPAAIRTLVSIIDRRCKLLGLDAPQRTANFSPNEHIDLDLIPAAQLEAMAAQAEAALEGSRQ